MKKVLRSELINELKAIMKNSDNEYVSKVEETTILEYLSKKDTYFSQLMSLNELTYDELALNIINDFPLFNGSIIEKELIDKGESLKKIKDENVSLKSENNLLKEKLDKMNKLFEKVDYENYVMKIKLELNELLEKGFGVNSESYKLLWEKYEKLLNEQVL